MNADASTLILNIYVTNERGGIGTITPGTKLEVIDVSGNTSSPLGYFGTDTAGKIALVGDSSPTSAITHTSRTSIGVYGTGSDRGGYFVGKGYFSNNVGIGTSSPQRSIHISGVMRLEPQSIAPSPASQGDIYMHDGTGTPNYPVLRVYDGTSWNDLW